MTDAGLKLNLKCSFFKGKLEYFGHEISDNGVCDQVAFWQLRLLIFFKCTWKMRGGNVPNLLQSELLYCVWFWINCYVFKK